MYKSLITGLAAALALAAWTGVTAAELFSKTGLVIAIMGNELFLGEAEGHLSGAGTIAIPLAAESGSYLRGAVHLQR